MVSKQTSPDASMNNGECVCVCFCQVVMAERRLECTWKRHVSEQLKLRDRVQRQAFEEIIQQCESQCPLSQCCDQPTHFLLCVLRLLNILTVVSWRLADCLEVRSF